MSFARAQQSSWDDFRLKVMAAEGALEQLIAGIRRELRLPSFEVALHWQPERPSRADRLSTPEPNAM